MGGVICLPLQDALPGQQTQVAVQVSYLEAGDGAICSLQEVAEGEDTGEHGHEPCYPGAEGQAWRAWAGPLPRHAWGFHISNIPSESRAASADSDSELEEASDPLSSSDASALHGLSFSEGQDEQPGAGKEGGPAGLALQLSAYNSS